MVRDISIHAGEIPPPPVGPEPELVYHYAGVTGLKGIIEHQCLWAGDVWYMNDAREARYGLDAISRALQAMTPTPGMESDVRQAALDQLARMEAQDEEVVHAYIACLSKNGDQLSQWRAYGRPRGFSIGFDRQALERLYPAPFELDRPSYRVVEYDQATQDRQVAEALQSMITKVPAVLPAADAGGIARLFILESLLPTFKSSAFQEEDEVRLQLLHGSTEGARRDLQFRDGEMGLTPYIEIPLKDPVTKVMTLLREVIIGPQANQKEAIRAVGQFLAYHGYNDAVVRASRIPLRG